MDLLIRFKLDQEGVEGTKILEYIGGVCIQDVWERQTEQEIVCSSACQLPRIKVGHFAEVGLAEAKGIEPVYAAVMPRQSSVGCFFFHHTNNHPIDCLQGVAYAFLK